MSSKLEHLKYLNSKGKFIIDCSRVKMTDEDVRILEKWGHWFVALVEGILQPFTEAQKDLSGQQIMKRKPLLPKN